MTRLAAAFVLGVLCAWAFARQRKAEPQSWAWRDAIEADYV